jgi:hypothetical protein
MSKSPAIYESVGGVNRKKTWVLPLETWRAVKGARRAFILILDGPLRPTESSWERSEMKFSEASFLRRHGLVLFSRNTCIITSTKARL